MSYELEADLQAAVEIIRGCAKEVALTNPDECRRLSAMADRFEADIAKLQQQAPLLPDPFETL